MNKTRRREQKAQRRRKALRAKIRSSLGAKLSPDRIRSPATRGTARRLGIRPAKMPTTPAHYSRWLKWVQLKQVKADQAVALMKKQEMIATQTANQARKGASDGG